MNLTVIRRFLLDSRELVHHFVCQLKNAVTAPKIIGTTHKIGSLGICTPFSQSFLIPRVSFTGKTQVHFEGVAMVKE
jgi:hypothetical protein